MIVLAIMTIPIFATVFSEEFNWDIVDFVIASFLLITLGFTIDFAVTKIGSKKFRIASVVLIIALFLLLWAEMSVGIIGSPLAGK